MTDNDAALAIHKSLTRLRSGLSLAIGAGLFPAAVKDKAIGLVMDKALENATTDALRDVSPGKDISFSRFMGIASGELVTAADALEKVLGEQLGAKVVLGLKDKGEGAV